MNWWVWLLLALLAIGLFVMWARADEKRKTDEQVKRADAVRRGRENAAWDARAIARRKMQDFFFAPGWSQQAECKVAGKMAKILMADDLSAIRLVFYDISDAGFRVVQDVRLAPEDIASAEVFVPTVRQEVYRDQSVPVFTSTKKSKLGRAVLGGLVAGPTGAVIGAMTGIGHKIEAHNETQRVFSHHAERAGQAVLLIRGAAGANFEIQLGGQLLHETWLNNIVHLGATDGA